MKFKFLDNVTMEYDGSQLSSLYAYRNYNLLGDSVISWVGPCNVKPEFMVDGEDLNAGEKICGLKMLHFILEKFDTSLLAAVAIQRLMTVMAIETLQELKKDKNEVFHLSRDGDDIFFGDQKLSISIATVSPVSALIHFAMNVNNEGTTVKTLALDDLKVDVTAFYKLFFLNLYK